ncbi:dUTP diphosphatase [Acinetobacter baumannii]|uniref:dUTP diphosphatase n=1 Tax=Acinetobacter baumannii TaxID=470 RepID=UPI00135FA458|nr:dUTP diphosphatase [Acinetobacter baumannii]CAA0280439.1 deoxyuridine 5'-triphosphate nucleotidohydrolase [Acinetobacter baumannii]
MVPVEVKILDDRLLSEFGAPVYATQGSAGLDLRACLDTEVTLNPGEQLLVSTGIAIHLKNKNLVGMLYPRSGLGVKHGIVLANGTGVIDSDYQGEIKACLRNNGDKPFVLKPGERIAQYVVLPTFQLAMTVVDEFDSSTERGEGGFGSTGTE